ncbi:hypothetical protein JGH11_10875 [Dysgonomonas sp. Marseille-P4677]|uniref:hypothetical protein n=1 Tax=Dysgonomonas sp. Marseille-P4677 TaxID=2364790 RepID=UPI001914C55A|nr:hypothetical protein [Dysgonomonas sp. Marseille-P4677]MBK5721376.1 hypothetical protein [Dysgonomonas sp. Marseille-P4677]
MKIIYNNILPFKGYIAINICGILFARRECKPLVDWMINHERIHTRQIMELFVVFFYLWYVIEWIIGVIRYRDKKQAYLNISFEREAYKNQFNLDYLKQRKPYSFTNKEKHP